MFRKYDYVKDADRPWEFQTIGDGCGDGVACNKGGAGCGVTAASLDGDGTTPYPYARSMSYEDINYV